jgi:ubiquinone/menaquinone biosynthesis C-methylase UbiE
MSEADDVRTRTRAMWEGVASAWDRLEEETERFAAPVTGWMLDAALLAPGQRVLELACGPGAVGLAAASTVAPGGEVLLTDAAEAMVEAARRRAQAAGVTNVSFRVLDAEWIDAPAASFDAVLCRWGLMFPADPEAALSECRRVLRPGGRLAVAAWDAPEANPMMTEIGRELLEQGLTAPPEPDAPGPFRFSPPGRLAELLYGGGFTEVEVETLELEARFPSFQAYWESQSARSHATQEALVLTNERGRRALVDGVRRRVEVWTRPDGSLRLPARPLVAAATA